MEHNKDTKNLKPQNTHSFLSFPTLRICGQLASWTGNPVPEQGEVGVRAILVFDTLTGEIATSQIEMQNEGNTSIFYSWQQCTAHQSFSTLKKPQSNKPLFYFNSSSGVILPGEKKLVEFSFKSEKPGIQSEVWQLKTQPVLLQGASIQVMLKGIALSPDTNADRRHLLQTKLEKRVYMKMCESIVCEMVRNVHTPERPGSPAEFFITEEQRFTNRNSKLNYLLQPVEELKALWQKVNPEQMWDFSVDTLHQVLLSLSEESSQETRGLVLEESLARFNFLLLKLSEPNSLKHQYTTAADLGRQLWIGLLDRMTDEAIRLKHLLNVTERETWINSLHTCETNLPEEMNRGEKVSYNREGVDEKISRSESKSSDKDENKGDSKSSTSERLIQVSTKKGKRRSEAVKHTKEKQTTMTDDSKVINQQIHDDKILEIRIYRKLLYQRVYALMEDLVDTMCDLLTDQDKDIVGEPNRNWSLTACNQPSVMF